VTADAPATLAWIAPAPPDAAQSRALEGWARIHGVRLAAPADGKPPAIVVDPSHADEVERLLDRVRDSIAARDVEATDRALSAAESTLRAHPELPQASWLMAEVERARSARFRRLVPLDQEAADRAWARAEALDEGRVPGVGEQAASAHPADATIAVSLDPPGATLWLDGHRSLGGALNTHAGAHTLVVSWDDAPVWAGWIETPAGSSSLHLAVPASPACSTGDVGRARAVAGTIDAGAVRCGSWVAALPGPRTGSVVVAMCEPGRCGPLLEWNTPASWTWTPPPDQGGHGKGWPTWATWGLVGAGAVIATGVVLVATGAFQSAPTEARFVSGGVVKQ
jgi:hypothetical protein